MSNYHQRIVSIHYNEADLPKFQTQEEIDAWHQAVGRMVCYGLAREAADNTEDTIQLVSGGLRQNPLELDLTYYTPKTPERYEDGTRKYINTPEEKLDTALTSLLSVRGFTIGAVLHSDGVWGFHS